MTIALTSWPNLLTASLTFPHQSLNPYLETAVDSATSASVMILTISLRMVMTILLPSEMITCLTLFNPLMIFGLYLLMISWTLALVAPLSLDAASFTLFHKSENPYTSAALVDSAIWSPMITWTTSSTILINTFLPASMIISFICFNCSMIFGLASSICFMTIALTSWPNLLTASLTLPHQSLNPYLETALDSATSASVIILTISFLIVMTILLPSEMITCLTLFNPLIIFGLYLLMISWTLALVDPFNLEAASFTLFHKSENPYSKSSSDETTSSPMMILTTSSTIWIRTFLPASMRTCFIFWSSAIISGLFSSTTFMTITLTSPTSFLAASFTLFQISLIP